MQAYKENVSVLLYFTLPHDSREINRILYRHSLRNAEGISDTIQVKSEEKKILKHFASYALPIASYGILFDSRNTALQPTGCSHIF